MTITITIIITITIFIFTITITIDNLSLCVIDDHDHLYDIKVEDHHEILEVDQLEDHHIELIKELHGDIHQVIHDPDEYHDEHHDEHHVEHHDHHPHDDKSVEQPPIVQTTTEVKPPSKTEIKQSAKEVDVSIEISEGSRSDNSANITMATESEDLSPTPIFDDNSAQNKTLWTHIYEFTTCTQLDLKKL
jgi:hypothetical protein